jgi:hypothetical protein
MLRSLLVELQQNWQHLRVPVVLEATQEALHALKIGSAAYRVLKRSDVQFLTPMNSSIRPSYVNWVRRGVTISTRRSKMMRESIFSDWVRRVSGDEESDGKCLVRRVARRCRVVRLGKREGRK